MFFLLLNCFAAAQTLIRDSCKTAAAKDPNLNYDFCVQSLEQDPQSKTATSLSGLVLASTTNAESKTTNLKGIVETILKNKTYPPGTEPALSTCVELYDDANNSLNEALMNVKSADYKSANVDLSAALDEPGTSAQTLIRDSCKTAAAKDPNLNYDFCVQSLEQDPQSKTATSLSGLVLASTTNAESKTTNLKGIVETILKNKTYPPGTEPALSTCVELYDDANNSLNEALMNVKSADYKSANVDLSAALDEPGTSAQTLIRDSCKTAAAKDPNLNYDFCVQSLEQDPQSKTATSLSGLVLASTNNAASKTINVKGIVETILKSKKYAPSTEPALRTCVKLYDDAYGSLKEALMNVKSSDYKSANIHLSAALDEPGICEDGFKEKHAKSPVTNENNVLFQKILIPLAFTNML
ncbi:hypothetical protein YC2023_024738 [Brassica napus]